MSNRFVTSARQCFMNVATCLQKRAYDTTNDKAAEIHKQLVKNIRKLHFYQHEYDQCLGNGYLSYTDSTARIINRRDTAISLAFKYVNDPIFSAIFIDQF